MTFSCSNRPATVILASTSLVEMSSLNVSHESIRAFVGNMCGSDVFDLTYTVQICVCKSRKLWRNIMSEAHQFCTRKCDLSNSEDWWCHLQCPCWKQRSCSRGVCWWTREADRSAFYWTSPLHSRPGGNSIRMLHSGLTLKKTHVPT